MGASSWRNAVPCVTRARAGWMGAQPSHGEGEVLGKGCHRVAEHFRGKDARNRRDVGAGAELGCSPCCRGNRTQAGDSHRSLPRSSTRCPAPSLATCGWHPSPWVPCLPLPSCGPPASNWLPQPPPHGVSSCAAGLSFGLPYLQLGAVSRSGMKCRCPGNLPEDCGELQGQRCRPPTGLGSLCHHPGVGARGCAMPQLRGG